MTATAMALLCAQPSLAADGARSPDTSVTRRVVVSIPDRKLALIENDRVVSLYPVAVGAGYAGGLVLLSLCDTVVRWVLQLGALRVRSTNLKELATDGAPSCHHALGVAASS